MLIAVTVGVALSRPPRTDRLSHIVVEIEVDNPRCPDWFAIETEARLAATYIATGRADVVMATSATITDMYP